MLPELDRAEGRRTDADWLEAVRADARGRFLLFDRLDPLFVDAEAGTPALFGAADLARIGIRTEDAVFLGLAGDAAWFAVDASANPAADEDRLADVGTFRDLHGIAGPIDPATWAVLSQARALLAWNARSRCCSVCGATTRSANAGTLRICSNEACDRSEFPRTDPAIIVRVTHGDRCLLGRQPRFSPRVRSVLAGFVEPGETLEDAVRREVLEEAGVTVEDITYFGSQPWPFPMTLMVAFTASTSYETIALEGSELEAADWYTRAHAREALASRALVLPSPKSISRALIDDWLQRSD